jgi:hypothetical protein
MSRVTIDCRTVPSETKCTLTLSGEPDEVLRAAAAHAVDVHGHVDGPELRDGLRAAMTEASQVDVERGSFVQLIEFRTQRIEDFENLERQWVEGIGKDRTARWSVIGADRTEPHSYVQMVGFPDYDSAMANSKHPQTNRIAGTLRELCEGEARYRDLDVYRVTTFAVGGATG